MQKLFPSLGPQGFDIRSIRYIIPQFAPSPTKLRKMAEGVNHQAVHDLLVEVARKAGDMIARAQPHNQTALHKKNAVDLVTETDRAVEKFIVSELRERYPEYDFYGEESFIPGMKLGDKPTWVVDPIDGTTNFVHTFATNVCVSLALCVYKKPVVGVIYNPYTTHMYTAIKNQGSYLTMPVRTDNPSSPAPIAPRKIRLPRRPPPPLEGLSSALIAVEWGNERSGHNWEVKTRTFQKLAGAAEEGGAMCHSLRSMGSAALNLCAVAAGQVDCYWEGGPWAWDVAAGWLILTESGGIMVDGNPGGWSPAVDGRRYLAVRAGEGQKEIVEEFWSCVQMGGYDY